jgi:UDP-N-acetylglucosamine 2-epimerase (non-hydrolysing)
MTETHRATEKYRAAVVLGTRPEAIKLAPVIRALKAETSTNATVIVTGQHRQMLDQVLQRFRIVPDVDLDLMSPNQSLGELTGRVLRSVEAELLRLRPDVILVQGDTTTAFVAALAGFYQRIPVAHVEAGLRSNDLQHPFPEEANRRLLSIVTAVHLAPTSGAAAALVREGIARSRVAVTGNTVVDALDMLLDGPSTLRGTPLDGVDLEDHRIILVTSHRRESWGHDLEQICLAIRDLVRAFPDVAVVYPVHLNPNVQATVQQILAGAERVHLTKPLDYPTFITLAKQSHFILTDSGGVQEEAPTLRKPLLLLRSVTERPEAFEAGRAAIVGTSRAEIVRAASQLLTDVDRYEAMSTGENPYGDGRASARIVRALRRWRQGRLPLLLPQDEFQFSNPAVGVAPGKGAPRSAPVEERL